MIATKKIRFEYDDEYGIEGVFESDGTLISAWSANDAEWRGEYFGELLAFLGGEELPPRQSGRDSRIEKMRDYLGV